ncbi:hypothetical protein ACLMAB_29360 [Brevibacillus laterosporus]
MDENQYYWEMVKKKHMLENFGITLIEIGHPGISPEEECICKTVAETAEQAEILMHARADIEEVRAAFRAKAHWVGIWEPRECARIVQLAVQRFSCEIEVHLHNDFGLAMANALAAIDAGASVIDTSLCGIGERAGIVDLLALATVLDQKRGIHQYKLPHIPQLTRMVSLANGYFLTIHQLISLNPM